VRKKIILEEASPLWEIPVQGSDNKAVVVELTKGQKLYDVGLIFSHVFSNSANGIVYTFNSL